MTKNFSLVAMALTALVSASPAFAQKSADSVRLALSDQVSVVDAYYNLQRENDFFSRQVFDTLVLYDQVKGVYVPNLAKSWTRISPTTIEFDLRDDVVFHNGDKFDADDVIYTINWLIDPKSKVPSVQRYNWIAKVEKLSPTKVRITSNEVNAADMLNYATVIAIYDRRVHGPLAEKSDYGRAPVGTGAFKVTQVDPNRGIVAVRSETYKHGPDWIRPSAKTVRGLPIPDKSVQLAHLLVGDIDVVADPSEDQLKELASNPSLKITSLPSFSMLYIQYDSINRSGKKELQDPRVREALTLAIDRQSMLALVSGGAAAELVDAMCFREMLACDYSTKPPAYDPVKAKKLLTEAGYPDGFDLELTARPVTKDAAVAIVGFWRKIGINASVDLVSLQAYTNKRNAGQLSAYFGERPYATFPDAGYALDVNFGNETRDYWRDPALQQAIKDGGAETDLGKRKAVYRAAFDLINRKFYMEPISTLPQTFVHAKDLAIRVSPARPNQSDIEVFQWK